MPVTIGASELATVLGVSPYGSQVDLWARLRGLLPRYDSIDTPDTSAGSVAEAGILLRYARERGVPVMPGPQLPAPGYVHPTEPWLAVRPDGLTPDRTVEAKAPRELWPEIPAHYVVQIVAQIAVAHTLQGWCRGDLAAHARAARRGDDYWRVWTIDRDPAVEEYVLRTGRDWYRRHVEDGTPPACDGRRATSEALARIWRPDDTVRDATPEDVADLHALLSVRAALEDLEGRRRELEQRIQARMGAATVLRRDGDTVLTWRPVRARETIDARRLRAERPDVAAAYTTRGEASRRFALTTNEETP